MESVASSDLGWPADKQGRRRRGGSGAARMKDARGPPAAPLSLSPSLADSGSSGSCEALQIFAQPFPCRYCCVIYSLPAANPARPARGCQRAPLPRLQLPQLLPAACHRRARRNWHPGSSALPAYTPARARAETHLALFSSRRASEVWSRRRRLLPHRCKQQPSAGTSGTANAEGTTVSSLHKRGHCILFWGC